MKTRRQKTTKVKRRLAPAAARRRGPSPNLQKELDQRTSELAEARKHVAEALEQQTATSDVLRVISSSLGDLKPVFDTMLANATRLCEAKFGSLFLRERDGFRNVCNIADPSGYTKWYQREPMIVLRDHHPQMPLARVAGSNAVIHIPDLATEQAYIERDPRMPALVESAGARSLLAVPMLQPDADVRDRVRGGAGGGRPSHRRPHPRTQRGPPGVRQRPADVRRGPRVPGRVRAPRLVQRLRTRPRGGGTRPGPSSAGAGGDPRVAGGHSPVVSVRLPCGGRRRRLSFRTGALGVFARLPLIG